MGGGLFILLALLALLIGTRARRSRTNLSEKAQRQIKTFKKFLYYVALAGIVLLLIFFIPPYVQQLFIALDTHFEYDLILGFGIIVLSILTIASLVKRLRE